MHAGVENVQRGLFHVKLSLIHHLGLCAVFVQAVQYPERVTASARTFPLPLYPPWWVDCLRLRVKEGSALTHLKHPWSTVSQGRSLSTLRWENTRHLGKVRDAKIQTPVLWVSSHSAMGQQSGSPPYRGGFFPKNARRVSFIAAHAQIFTGKTVFLCSQRHSFS